MTPEVPTAMKSVPIDPFGGPAELKLWTLPVPEAADGEVLVHVEAVHVAASFPLERVADAWEMVGRHHLGKVVLRV